MSSSDDDGAGLTGGHVKGAFGKPISRERLDQYAAELVRIHADSRLTNKQYISRSRKVIKALASHRDLRYNTPAYANLFVSNGSQADVSSRVTTLHLSCLADHDTNTGEFGSWRHAMHIFWQDGIQNVLGYQGGQKVASDLHQPTGRSKHQDVVVSFIGPHYAGIVNNGITVRPEIKTIPNPANFMGGQFATGAAAFGLHGNY